MRRLVLIGDGVAARVCLYRVLASASRGELANLPFNEVFQVFDPHLSPGASWRSTAHVGTHGITHGTGALGDVLLEACREAFTFFRSLDSPREWGVEKGEHLALVQASDAQAVQTFERRFGSVESDGVAGPQDSFQSGADLNFAFPVHLKRLDHYALRPQIFLSRIELESQRLAQSLGIEWIKKEGRGEKLKDGELYYRDFKESIQKSTPFEFSMACPGAFEALREKPLSESPKEFLGQVRPGSYWHFSTTQDRLPEAFRSLEHSLVLSLKGSTLIYRPASEEMNFPAGILIGGTSFHWGHFTGVTWSELFYQWESWVSLLGGRDSWPSFHQGQVLTGFRHHLPKRRPYLGPLKRERNNLFFQDCFPANSSESAKFQNLKLSGLYKNGYSLSFLAAKKWVSVLGQFC